MFDLCGVVAAITGNDEETAVFKALQKCIYRPDTRRSPRGLVQRMVSLIWLVACVLTRTSMMKMSVNVTRLLIEANQRLASHRLLLLQPTWLLFGFQIAKAAVRASGKPGPEFCPSRACRDRITFKIPNVYSHPHTLGSGISDSNKWRRWSPTCYSP